MNSKKIVIGTTVALLSTFSTVGLTSDFSVERSEFPVERSELEIQSAGVVVSAFIIDRAKNALLSQAQSWLTNQLFGSSGSPSIVNLHQDSLDAIQEIVAAELQTHRYLQLQQDFNGYIDQLQYVHDIANNGGYDGGAINNLVQDGTALTNHSSYTAQGHSHYFTLTASRASAYAMLLSVYTERALNDTSYTHANIRNQAVGWAANLTSMGAAADAYISSNISIEYMPPSMECIGAIIHSDDNSASTLPGGRRCTTYVRDGVSGKLYSYNANMYGYDGANQGASHQYNLLVSRYRQLFKGDDFNEVIEHLENF